MNLSDSVKLALLNVQKESITDVDAFTRPFEIDLLRDEKVFAQLKETVEGRIRSSLALIKGGSTPFDALRELRVSPIRSLLMPKKNLFDFRQCSYTEPLDEIIYLSLVIALSNKIEKSRIRKNLDIIYSYRLRSNLVSASEPTYIFDSKFNYTKFRRGVSLKAKGENIKVVVACDIANFYDRLNLHRLENTLHAIPEIDHDVIRLLNELLLYWSNRDSYGLPVGSNASRILAEASLINVDKFLLGRKVKFSRYVDDYRLFARDASEAHSWLSVLVERLSQEGLFLNTSKTSIIEAKKIVKDGISEANSTTVDSTADQEMERTDLPIIIRGYSGLIPTKFRKISCGETYRLNREDQEKIRQSALESDLIKPEDFTRYVRITVAKSLWKELAEISTVLKRFPQFVPYYLDCARKYSNSLGDHKELISKNIEELIRSPVILEYLRIYAVRFFINKDFKNKELVMDYFSNLRRGEGVYLGRAILESIQNIVSREDVLVIKSHFTRADKAEKRMILKIMRAHLYVNEFNAFYKNISLDGDDVWHSLIYSAKTV